MVSLDAVKEEGSEKWKGWAQKQANKGPGCKHWHRWSSLWPINYLLYFVFSVSTKIGDICA